MQFCTSCRAGTEKFCHRETQLAVCQKHPRGTGQCDCVQHHRNCASEWTEAIQLSHICDGKDERSRCVSGKGRNAGASPMVLQSA